MQGGITSRFALLISLVVLAATGTVGFMVYQGVQEALMQAAGDRIAHTAETVRVRIDARLHGIGEDVQFLAETPPVQGIVRARLRYGLDPETAIRDDEWGEQLADIFRAFLQSRQSYLQARLIGLSGGARDLVRVERHGSEVVFANPELFRDRGGEEYVQHAAELGTGDVYVSEVAPSEENGLPPGTLVFYVSTPVHSEQGQLFGVITIAVDFADMLGSLGPIEDEDRTLYVAVGRGRYLFASDGGPHSRFEAVRNTSLQRVFPEADALAQGRASELRMLDAKLEGDTEGIVHFNRLPLDSRTPSSGLLIGVAEPHDTILAGVRAVRNESALVTLLLGLGALGLALSVSGYLTRPLRQITKAVDSFGSRGDMTALPVDRGDEIGLLARAFQTMTQQIQNQIHELADDERRQRAILETSAEGIIVTDARGRIEAINPAAETIFGYTGADAVSRPADSLIRLRGVELRDRPCEETAGADWLDLCSGQETIGTRKDGSKVPLFILWSAFRLGGEQKYTIFAQDITQRKEAEAARERLVRALEAERARLEELSTNLEERVRERTADLELMNRELEASNRELREFAHVASHDLQEPLRKLRSFADLLQTECDGDLNEHGRDYLARIYGAAERMSRQIADLIAFSHVASPPSMFREVDLGPLAYEVAAGLQAEIARADAEVMIGELPTIEADPEQMRHLLHQLLGNAIAYRRSDVSPVVEVRAEQEREADQGRASSAVWHIEVKDNGIGFDEKHLDRIFAPFERLEGRRDEGGTGMGLTICRRIVMNHGGTITAHSTPGEGSTFVITLASRRRKPQ